MHQNRDTTVTIHPTIRQSTNAALYRISVEKNIPIGWVLEEVLLRDPEFRKIVEQSKNGSS